MKVLAVEEPAPCALDCAFCRTPEHDVGDPKAVLEAVKSNLDGCDELYVTSNGETGRSSIFGDLLQIRTYALFISPWFAKELTSNVAKSVFTMHWS